MKGRDYNSFGMKFENSDYVNRDNKYLYFGKELIEHSGLECYDYGARFYDPSLGRWHCIDPWAEDFISISPYHYVYNNPVNGIDPNGKGGVLTFDEDNETATLTFNLHLYTGDGVTNEDISNALKTAFGNDFNGTIDIPVEEGLTITGDDSKEYSFKAQIAIYITDEKTANSVNDSQDDLSNNFFEVRQGSGARGKTSEGNKNTGWIQLGAFSNSQVATNVMADELWHTTDARYWPSGSADRDDSGEPGSHNTDRTANCSGNPGGPRSNGAHSVKKSDINALKRGIMDSNQMISRFFWTLQNNRRIVSGGRGKVF